MPLYFVQGWLEQSPSQLALQKCELLLLYVIACVCVSQSANQSCTFLSGNSYMPLSCCCTWKEAQSNTKHKGERGGGGLLASSRLNKQRVKEMKREALFRDDLIFFMGCNQKCWNKGRKRATLREQKTGE